jgi:hypothetical protein
LRNFALRSGEFTSVAWRNVELTSSTVNRGIELRSGEAKSELRTDELRSRKIKLW